MASAGSMTATPSWCLFHEIAHAMTTTSEGHSDGHGPLFLGLYLHLIVRYLRMEEGALLRRIAEEGIKVTIAAQAIFSSI
jgi:hypothetical protein